MEIAKIFENGGSQAVRLPKKFRFTNKEVMVVRLGVAVMLVPKDKVWQTFLEGLDSFSDDYFENGREEDVPTQREAL